MEFFLGKKPKSAREEPRVARESERKSPMKHVPAYVNKWLNRNSENRKVLIADRRRRLNSFPSKIIVTDEEIGKEVSRANIRGTRSFESMANVTSLTRIRTYSVSGQRSSDVKTNVYGRNKVSIINLCIFKKGFGQW